MTLLRLSALLAVSVLLPLRTAGATPFTLPRGQLALELSVTLDQATAQWTDAGVYGDFSLGGKFSAQTTQLAARYGILDSLEVSARATYKNATYTAAPIHLFRARSAVPTQGELTGDIFNFSGQETGFGDLFLGISYRPLTRGVNLAVESEIKIPTGYRAPSGTFCDNVAPADALARVAATLQDPQRPRVVPRDFCNSTTLGDGQVDWALLGQVGRYLALTRTFLRLDAGMNFRLQGPGQQVVGALKVGENIFDRLVLYVGARAAYTLNRGAVVGTTINSARPGALPEEYPVDAAGVLLLLPEAAVRDRSYVFIDAGLIVRLPQRLELRGNFARAVWGQNFPEITSASLGVAFAL